MKLSKIISMAMLLCLALSCFALHPDAGEYSYQFLNIHSDPAMVAMGGRGVHALMDKSAFTLQPAIGAVKAHQNVGVSYMTWLDDSSCNQITYSSSDRISHFGITLRNLDYGKVESRDETGVFLGYYHPVSLSVMGNYAHRITPIIFAGANLGMLYEKLGTASSVGFHSDLGLTLLPPINNSSLSMTVRNLGTATSFDKERSLLPVSFETDLGKHWEWEDATFGLEVSAVKAVDEYYKFSVASQVGIWDKLYLRGAYKIKQDPKSLSAGLGFRLKNIDIDYAWAANSSGLNDVHSFGLKWNF
ncbi:MAG TPA: PorV/PorQ family protein [Candidatus Cloacimonadota bacterium]|mgnify:CR=1 FL=1|nr:PorV/PorQ family protein [Candidatus Cloacimonadota bacterium]